MGESAWISALRRLAVSPMMRSAQQAPPLTVIVGQRREAKREIRWPMWPR